MSTNLNCESGLSNINTKMKPAISIRLKKTIKRSYVGWLFALPMILGLSIFTVYPVISSLIYSFFEYDGITVFKFIGIENYIRIFVKDTRMPMIIKNTVIYSVVSIPLNLVLSYFLALLVKKNDNVSKCFRILYYSPVIIPSIVGGLLWSDMFDPNCGVFNQIIRMVTNNPDFKYNFFTHESTALLSVFIKNLWMIGGGMILWISAFNNIPKSLYECMSIDGAGAFKKFIYLTIPLSTPMIFFNVVMSIIGTLQYSDTLTFASNDGRGPENSLYMYGVKIFHEYSRRHAYGYASSLAWVLLVVVGTLTFVIFKTSKKWVIYGGDN